jgi:hypothetical protein
MQTQNLKPPKKIRAVFLSKTKRQSDAQLDDFGGSVLCFKLEG